MKYPFPKTWWIEPGKVLGGCYPGPPYQADQGGALAALLDVGVRVVINLQQPGELGRNRKPFADYEPLLRQIAADNNVGVTLHRFPIRDWGAPALELMVQIQKALAEATQDGNVVYVHCWGGHGRTGTVGACRLISQGMSIEQAIAAMRLARQHDPLCAKEAAPQSTAQFDFLRQWANHVAREQR